MKLAGRKLLHQWDLRGPQPSFDEVVRSCQDVALTGFAELTYREAAALIFYYQGLEVNALYREGPVAYNGRDALDRIARHGEVEGGVAAIYELPLDMAHLLRGITRRHRLPHGPSGRAGLAETVHGLEKSSHTGIVEISASSGAAVILLIRGRLANVYWESATGITAEGAPARRHLDEAVDAAEVTMWLSEFSRDAFMGRHELQRAVESRLTRREAQAAAPDQLAVADQARRNEVLDELAAWLPSLLRAMIVDLPTGVVLAQRGSARSDATATEGWARLSRYVPNWACGLRAQLEADDPGAPALETFEITAGAFAAHVGVVPGAFEAVAVVTERSQPAALVAGAVTRAVHAYRESLTASSREAR